MAEITCYGSQTITDVTDITRVMVFYNGFLQCTHTDLPLESMVSNSTLLNELSRFSFTRSHMVIYTMIGLIVDKCETGNKIKQLVF